MHAETKAILETNLAAVLRRIADARREAKELQPVANELRAMINGVLSCTVKIDGLECMRKAMAPGAILLSADAVSKFADLFGYTEVGAHAHLTALGGIASTAEKGACDA